MRLLHILRPAAMGGCERQLALLLPQLVRRGHRVRLLLLARDGYEPLIAPLRSGGVDVVRIRPGPRFNPAMPAVLFRQVASFRPDVVHTHSMAGDVYGQIAARAARVPGVSTLHGTYPFYRRPPYRAAAGLAGRLARRTIANSHHVGRFAGGLRIVPRRRLRVIYYGVDVARPEPSPEAREVARRRWRADGDRVVVGSASRLVPGKGHRVLLEAARRTASIDVWVAGDGPLRAELERDAPANVRFFGFVEDMACFLTACDVLAFPTLPSFGEGFPQATLDAMEAGLPVVASDVDSLPEQVVHGVTGLLVPPGDPAALAGALSELAQDCELRAAMGKQGRERVLNTFPLNSTVEATLAVYAEARGDRVSKVDRSTWEAAWSDRVEVEQTYSNDDRILHNLKGLLDLDGATVLEVGGGSGRDGLGLVGAGATVCELDYAEASLGIMRRIGEGKQRFRVVGGDATSLPFPDGAFDVVFHQGLLEHFRPDDARALLQENIRVLAPGGLLLVDVPQRWHPYTLLKHALMAVNKWFAGWERSFSMGELKRVLRDEGLEVVHTYGAWMYPSLPYRVVREALKWVGLYLPLHPPRVPVLCSLRDAARRTLGRSKFPLVTDMSMV